MKVNIPVLAVGSFVFLLGAGLYAKTNTSSVTTPSPIETVVISAPRSTSPLTTTTNSLVLQTKTILKLDVKAERALYLNTVVDANSVEPLIASIKRLNKESSAPIVLQISSPGGSVLDGAALISEMEASKAPIYTVCTYVCASMAAMIHGHGAKRYGLDRAILMYHPASGGAQGQVRNMLSQLTTVNNYIEKMVGHIVANSKMSQEEFQKVVAYELWIDSEDAVAKGLNDASVNLSLPSSPEGLGQLPSPEEQGPVRYNPGFQMIAPAHLLYLWDRNVRKAKN